MDAVWSVDVRYKIQVSILQIYKCTNKIKPKLNDIIQTPKF